MASSPAQEQHAPAPECPSARLSLSDPSVLIALNRPALAKFEADVAPRGVIIYDSPLIDGSPSRQDVEIVAMPVTRIADRIGSASVADMSRSRRSLA